MAKVLLKLKKMIFSRLVITVVLVLAQAYFLFATFYWLGNYMPIISVMLTLLTGVLLIYVVNRDINPAFKLTWAIPLCLGRTFVFICGDQLYYLCDQKDDQSKNCRGKALSGTG